MNMVKRLQMQLQHKDCSHNSIVTMSSNSTRNCGRRWGYAAVLCICCYEQHLVANGLLHTACFMKRCFAMQLDISYDSFVRTTDKRHEVSTVPAKDQTPHSLSTIYALCLTFVLIVTGLCIRSW